MSVNRVRVTSFWKVYLRDKVPFSSLHSKGQMILMTYHRCCYNTDLQRVLVLFIREWNLETQTLGVCIATEVLLSPCPLSKQCDFKNERI